MAFGNRLINTSVASNLNCLASSHVGPFTSASYLRDAQIGVSTTSFWGKMDSTLHPDGFCYSTSRSGVGYWLISKTDLSTNTTTTISQGTPGPAYYGFVGVANKDELLYIVESDFSRIVTYQTDGTRLSVFSNTATYQTWGAGWLDYNCITDEFILTDTEGSGTQQACKLHFIDGTTGNHKRTIDISATVGLAHGLVWANVGGDGVLFVMNYYNSRAYQFNYNGSYTGFYVDYSPFIYVQNQNRGGFFNPQNDELTLGTFNSQSGDSLIKNKHRVFQLA